MSDSTWSRDAPSSSPSSAASSALTRVLAVGDIGVVDGMIHIGDEAMFEALADELGARGIQLTAVSWASAETSERYAIPAVAAEQTAVLDAVSSADAVVIAGGGNMASNWPHHIRLRHTIGTAAARAGIPLVVTGQTIGPKLVGDDRVSVGELLMSAQLVGVREGASEALVRELGVDSARMQRNVDDAAFLAWDFSVAAVTSEYCLVSLSTHLGGADRAAAVRTIAALLDRVAASGTSILFHAHWAALDPALTRGDSVLHEEVRAAMTAESSVHPTTDARAAAALARNAALLLSSRYHPAVFATAAGVPTIGISVDGYTTVKLTGALGAFGQDAVVSLHQMLAAPQVGTDALARVTRDADVIRSRGRALAAERRVDSAAWWDRVAEALRG